MNKKKYDIFYYIDSLEWWEDKEEKYLVHFICMNETPHTKIKDGYIVLSAYVDKLRTFKGDMQDIEKFVFTYKILNNNPYVFRYEYILRKHEDI